MFLFLKGCVDWRARKSQELSQTVYWAPQPLTGNFQGIRESARRKAVIMSMTPQQGILAPALPRAPGGRCSGSPFVKSQDMLSVACEVSASYYPRTLRRLGTGLR